MEYFDQTACDYLSLGFAFDEGYGSNGEINVMASASLQNCNGAEITNYNLNGTGIAFYNNNQCSFKGNLTVENPLNGSQFADYIKSIINNTSQLAQKKIIFSENDENQPDCTGFIIDLFNKSLWVRNYSDYGYVYLYQGDKSEDCTNTTKNWNETSDLLGMARESAYQLSLDKRCPGIRPTPSPSDDNGLNSGLIAGGVLTGVCIVALLAAYILHKKDHNGYTTV